MAVQIYLIEFEVGHHPSFMDQMIRSGGIMPTGPIRGGITHRESIEAQALSYGEGRDEAIDLFRLATGFRGRIEKAHPINKDKARYIFRDTGGLRDIKNIRHIDDDFVEEVKKLIEL
jgi:hypothetical protein